MPKNHFHKKINFVFLLAGKQCLLTTVSNVNTLGIIFDSKLSFDSHIETIYNFKSVQNMGISIAQYLLEMFTFSSLESVQRRFVR